MKRHVAGQMLKVKSRFKLILDKKPDNSQILLSLPNGKQQWLKTSRLIKEDQQFIKNWSKPVPPAPVVKPSVVTQVISAHLTIIENRNEAGELTAVTLHLKAGDNPISCTAKPAEQAANNGAFLFKGLLGGQKKEAKLLIDRAWNIEISDGSGKELSKFHYDPEVGLDYRPENKGE